MGFQIINHSKFERGYFVYVVDGSLVPGADGIYEAANAPLNYATAILAVARPGYVFNEWMGAPNLSGSDSPWLQLIPGIPVPEYGVGALFGPGNLGDAGKMVLRTSAGAGGSVSPDVETLFVLGATATVTATPDAGFSFSGWGGDASGSTNPLTVTMDADKTITAVFSQGSGGGETTIAPYVPPPAQYGEAYSYAYTPTNGAGPYTFAVTAGVLPAGLALDGATGEISGSAIAPILDSDACTPTITMQISRDGGFTWGNERTIPLAKLGQYLKRLRWLMCGRGRLVAIRIFWTAAVDTTLIAAYLDVKAGTS